MRARVSTGNKQGGGGNKLTEQGDVVPVLRVDDPHRGLVQAQLPSVRLKRAGDGAVRRVCEVIRGFKEGPDYIDETTRGRDCISIRKRRKRGLTLALPVAGQVLWLIFDEEVEED